MRKIAREVGLFLVLVAVVFGPALVAGQGPGALPPAGGFPDLVGALKATPGCLGVETAQTASGKQVIFAWFENKKAVLNWYYSDTHLRVKNQFAPGAPPRQPLGDVPDDGQPVLAIASLTLTGRPTGDVKNLPISQIAIELYRPLPGGLAAGGTFAPAALKVPGMQIVPLTAPSKDEHPAAQARPADAQRFDMAVRADFFAGFTGDEARLKKGMDTCERVLADNSDHAEALVWHGSGLAYNAGMAFQKGDMKTGGELWQRGMQEMDKAVALEPDNVGVLIPRGALLLQATQNMPPDMGRPLLEKAVGDYEHVLALQSSYFSTLGDHPKGELLFGLAVGYSRLGNLDKARMYFDRLIKDAPASGQAPKARTWLSTGALPKSEGLGCVGCHK